MTWKKYRKTLEVHLAGANLPRTPLNNAIRAALERIDCLQANIESLQEDRKIVLPTDAPAIRNPSGSDD